MTAAPGPQQPDEVPPAACEQCCPSGWSPNIDQVPDENCPLHGRPAAPSAQPDEVRKDMPSPREAAVIAAELAVVEKLSRPAQPVRDTGEGRR